MLLEKQVKVTSSSTNIPEGLPSQVVCIYPLRTSINMKPNVCIYALGILGIHIQKHTWYR